MDDDVTPLLLLGYIDCAQPPGEFEVFSRLKAAGFAPEASEDCPDSDGDALWHACFTWPDRETAVRMFAGPTRDYEPWRTTRVVWADEAEFGRARNSRWVIGVESIQAEPPSDFFHLLLRLVVAACGDDLTAFADTASTRVRGAVVAREMADCPVPPAPDELVAVHWVGGDDDSEYWSHTHGLHAYGSPEIEVLGASREAGPGVEFMLLALAEMLMVTECKADGDVIEFGDGLVAQLRPVGDAISKFPAALLGGTADHEDHAGWRLLVLDEEAPWPPRKGRSFERLAPVRLIEAVSGTPIIYHSNSESERQTGLAKLRFAQAAMTFLSSDDPHKALIVKLGIPADQEQADYSAFLLSGTAPEGTKREHMWFQVSDFQGGVITGKLDNDPSYARYLQVGGEYQVSADKLSGFQLFVQGQTYTPEMIARAEKAGFVTDWRDFRDIRE